ncbi:MAG TPA: serine/threonine-protein kinase [Spirillospora sp.]
MQALRDRDPRKLGPYRLLGRLGRGGMGTVFLGEDDTGRQVAVKVINAELADDDAFHERFRSEVTAARQVRRFCTAPVLDAQLDGDPLYVVTEYVAGPSLEDAVRDGGPLRGGDLEALAVNIATALTAIHGAGIVHRDLKPSNVLLSPTGPRVIDFGIARALDAPDGPTRTGQFIGTPAYMAPELMRGEEITPAADVFSWGCVVAYAGTGRAPFGGTTLPQVIDRVTRGEPDLDGLDPAMHDLVARSLAKNPADRPSVKQLIQTLTGGDEPPEAPPTVAFPAPARPAAGTPAEQSPETAADRPADPPATEPTAETPAEPVPEPAAAAAPPTRTAPAEQPPRPDALPPHGPPPNVPPSPSRTTVDAVPETDPIGAAPAASVKQAQRPADRRPNPALILLLAGVVILAVWGAIFMRSSDDDKDDGSGTASGAPAAAGAFGEKPPEVQDRIFEDDFDDPDSGWKNVAAATRDAGYVDDRYELRVLPSTRSTAVPAPSSTPASQLIDVRVTHTDGEAGVYCRGDDGYAFLLRPDGRVRIARLDGGGMREVATGTATRLRDDDNRVQAACVQDGSKLNLGFWVNGRAAASTTVSLDPDDRTGAPGASGLVLHRPDGTAGRPEATFDRFTLCSV